MVKDCINPVAYWQCISITPEGKCLYKGPCEPKDWEGNRYTMVAFKEDGKTICYIRDKHLVSTVAPVIDAEEMNKALILVNSTIARAKRNERTDKWQDTVKIKEEPVPSPHPYLDPLFPVQDIRTNENTVYFKAIRKVL